MTDRGSNTYIIDYLGHYTQFIPVIAQWHQNEWQHISPDLSTRSRIELYSSYKNSPAVPNCLIALVDDKPAGSASLVFSDMQTYPHLSPWLASVYVDTPYRCNGIASQLITQCISNARQSGIQTLYLFTPEQTDFYRNRGWKILESTLYHGENVDIMYFNIPLHIEQEP